MAEVEEQIFHSAAAFVSELRPSNARWWDGRTGRRTHFFRGHSSVEWRLLPSAQRPLGATNALTPIVESLENRISTGDLALADRIPEENRSYVLWGNAMHDALYDFRDICRSVGLPTPHFDGQPSSLRAVLQGETELPNPAFAAIAQHHGIPTVLLDWTENPLVAAYFALERDNEDDLCVWAIREASDLFARVAELSYQLKFVRFPAGHATYLSAQAGLFTHIAGAADYFISNGEWLDLERFNQTLGENVLTKLILRRTSAVELREQLFREGISKAHLMPTYDNVGVAARDRWQDLARW